MSQCTRGCSRWGDVTMVTFTVELEEVQWERGANMKKNVQHVLFDGRVHWKVQRKRSRSRYSVQPSTWCCVYSPTCSTQKCPKNAAESWKPQRACHNTCVRQEAHAKRASPQAGRVGNEAQGGQPRWRRHLGKWRKKRVKHGVVQAAGSRLACTVRKRRRIQ